MTETTDTSGASQPSEPAPSSARGRKDGIEGMLLPQLKQLAGGLGIKTTGMRKGAVIEAIKAHQQQGGGAREPRRATASQQPAQPAQATQATQATQLTQPAAEKPQERERAAEPTRDQGNQGNQGNQGDRRDRRDQGDRGDQRDRGDRGTQATKGQDDGAGQGTQADQGEARAEGSRRNRTQGRKQDQPEKQDDKQQDKQQGRQKDQQKDQPDDKQQDGRQQDRQNDRQQGRQQNDRQQDKQNDRNDRQQNRQQNDRNDGRNDRNDGRNDGRDDQDDDEGGSRRNRRRRGRDRQQGPAAPAATGRGHRNEPDLQILEDDVLTSCAGILDLMDNYAFVRTSGYLPGVDDVYVSMSMVRRFGLRRGDAVTGQVRQPREGERKEKFNPLVRLDSVNGADPETARSRVEFAKLTPLYPSERLRLETGPTDLIGRVMDIAAPIGKGQRGLVVSPAKAGKTMVLQALAHSITTNNPECHLMVVLVDERPEEVTDFQRSVKGEVVASTFDRPPGDHTIVAELSIERAKRLVELGHDVVVLLDGITRLGRAYNLATPASGRTLAGGVDSAALYPPKRFFGAARNIENGGSLTIIATALVESGSTVDEVIFEEFTGTGNMEVRLRRDVADKRIFPAIDVVQSGTRREEQLLEPAELATVWQLRRELAGLEGQEAVELLLGRLRSSQSNLELLGEVRRRTPAAGSSQHD
ncbi:transcription termination factor Rho [Nocardioides aurantiacus]|uniref:Transcription termination factor Rho n=1 Tax=Nocardioides aurantiacus TaxID=86796 RepID=A0A3N2CQN9_9ACTN|nr:transcription termination factor Rho [Nocardioides aurantiacus]ROR89842.1 transcription termination factor Rho [Nocardioides aurantiacus]